MNSRNEPDWQALDALLRHDPGGRGVAAFQERGQPLAAGHLRAAAKHLAEHGQSAAIVTGFAIVGRNPPAAETDGPPGALYLARVLAALGVETTLITDRV
ncbi:MAG TPA: glutamate cyclase domain-containing protein, partial [Pirellulales bacterium]|nr:glutamate cyclase domain-containing protein [Pirellulales bacterium]